MIDVRPFAGLGHFQNEWLNARHHFSFGHYHDLDRMGLGGLRVWNDDEVAPGNGFDPHPHRDMEIITFVRQGAITHRDNLGNTGRTGAGDVQVMHAGRGIVHAEFNQETELTRLFQIWIVPSRLGVAPGWEMRHFPRQGGLRVLASGRAEDTDALPLHADAAVLAGTLQRGELARHTLRPGRAAYLVASAGSVTVNGQVLGPRDGAAITGEPEVTIAATGESELVLVDVAA